MFFDDFVRIEHYRVAEGSLGSRLDFDETKGLEDFYSFRPRLLCPLTAKSRMEGHLARLKIDEAFVVHSAPEFEICGRDRLPL